MGTRLRRRLSKIFQRERAEIGLAISLPFSAAHPWQEPRHDLPIAPHPAMPPDNIHEIAPGIFLVERQVADQSATSVNRLQQIVAENSVFRKASGQCAFERVDLVDSLSDERAFLKKVLIHIGDRASVRIDPRIARVEPDEP